MGLFACDNWRHRSGGLHPVVEVDKDSLGDSGPWFEFGVASAGVPWLQRQHGGGGSAIGAAKESHGNLCGSMQVCRDTGVLTA